LKNLPPAARVTLAVVLVNQSQKHKPTRPYVQEFEQVASDIARKTSVDSKNPIGATPLYYLMAAQQCTKTQPRKAVQLLNSGIDLAKKRAESLWTISWLKRQRGVAYAELKEWNLSETDLKDVLRETNSTYKGDPQSLLNEVKIEMKGIITLTQLLLIQTLALQGKNREALVLLDDLNSQFKSAGIVVPEDLQSIRSKLEG
jgi:hypothetical protein